MDPLVIWCNVPLATSPPIQQRLLDAVTGHTLHAVDGSTPADQSRSWLARASVAFGHPPVDVLLASDAIRWVEIASAGYEAYDRADLREALGRRGARVTNAGGVYADACAQHTLAMILAASRALPAALAAQHERRWAFTDLRPHMQRLTGQRVLILGWGQIARRLVELLQPFGVDVTAVRRQLRGDEGVRVIGADGGDLDAALARADHLVDLLPGGAGTRQFVNAERLARLPRGARFYNVGRGSTVDQEALIAALERGHLAGAWLDVTDPEPLPPDHRLWHAPGCYITPHLAGGQADERDHQVQHFLENLARFTRSRALVDQIMP